MTPKLGHTTRHERQSQSVENDHGVDFVGREQIVRDCAVRERVRERRMCVEEAGNAGTGLT